MTTFRKFDWNRARSDFATLFDDFFSFPATDLSWLATKVGTGTLAVQAGAGGILKVTNSAANNDEISAQFAGGTAAVVETFKYVAGKKLQFVARFSLSDVLASAAMFGLCITDTEVIGGVTDGIYFRKDAASARLYFVTEKNSTETVVDTGIDLVNDTMITVEFYYDGSAERIAAYANGIHCGAAQVVANFPDDEELALTFAVKNTAAAAKSASIDFIGASQQR
jgi:hypothetical protein